jgi:taurine dioxygenase
LVEIDGQVGGAWLGWHSDLVYHHEINHGGMLRGLQLTSRGGLTGFIDQIDAYSRLPEDLKVRIEDLNVVYQLGMIDQFPNAYRGHVRVVRLAEHSAKIMDRVETDFPPVIHPLVFVQRETGRKVLNLSPMFARYIETMQDAEGDSLLAELCRHILDCPQYHHRWTLDDLLLWDNWRMLHSISPAPADEPRVMQRTTIVGDYALGRKMAERGVTPSADRLPTGVTAPL